MIDPDFSDVPRFTWYELSYRNGMLTLDVEPNAFAVITTKLTADNKRVKSVQVALKLDEFIPAEATCWGFGRVLESTGESSRGWRRFTVKYPRMLRTRNAEEAWRPAYGIIGSLNLIFRALNNWTVPVEQSSEQVVMVDGPGLKSGGLSAGLSPRAARWLQQSVQGSGIESLRHAMLNASRALGDEYDPVDDLRLFLLQNDGGLLHLAMPTSVGLHPTHHEKRREGLGYQLHGRNVDTPYQQLVLLAGLARLCEAVRA